MTMAHSVSWLGRSDAREGEWALSLSAHMDLIQPSTWVLCWAILHWHWHNSNHGCFLAMVLNSQNGQIKALDCSQFPCRLCINLLTTRILKGRNFIYPHSQVNRVRSRKKLLVSGSSPLTAFPSVRWGKIQRYEGGEQGVDWQSPGEIPTAEDSNGHIEIKLPIMVTHRIMRVCICKVILFYIPLDLFF